MAKKVLLCGEGPTDYGRQKYGSTEWEEGPVQSIIRKSVQVKVDIEFTCATKKDVKRVRIQRTSAKLKGHGVKAYQLCVIASELGDIDNIVCYVDADRDSGSSKSARDAKKRVQDIYNEIQMGFAQFSATRSESSFPMIPLKMIESWLLADEIAFTACFGKPPTKPSLPRQPELIWGDENDPTSDHPKNYLKRVLEQYGKQGTIELFICVAKNMTTDILRRKCSISFEPFYQDVQVIARN